MRTAISLVRIVFGLALLTATTLPESAATPDQRLGRIWDEDCLPKNPPPPVLKLKVLVPADAEPGQALVYRICVENCSPSEAHHVVVKNALPRNARYVTADPLPTKQGEELHWPMGTIGAGAAREIRLTLMPTNKEDVKNCVRVQFEHGLCVTTRQALRPGEQPPLPPLIEQPKPPTIEPVPEVKLKPELELVVEGLKEQYANLPTKYLIRVINKGKVKAERLIVRSQLPPKLSVEKGTTEPKIVLLNDIVWQLGTLDPGTGKALTLVLKASEKGVHCFTTAVIGDAGVEKKETLYCTNFRGKAAMSVEMFDNQDPVFVGEKTSYTVKIRNPGSDDLTNVQLRAIVPGQLRFATSDPLPDKLFPLQGGFWVEFRPATIKAGEAAVYLITCDAVIAGLARFEVRITADQLDQGPVVEQESTTVLDDRR